jgi:tight adherence protein C
MELFIVLAFVSAVALALAVSAAAPDRPAVKRRLARLADGTTAPVPTEDDGGGLLESEKKGWLVRLLAPLAGKANRSDSIHLDHNRKRLCEAGYRRESALVLYMGSRVALALTLPIVMLAMSPMWALTEMKLIVLLCGAAGVGLVAPSYFIDKRRAARKLDMVLGLPDALDLMVVCVEAGLGINQSLLRISREFARNHPILAAEFELVTMEIRAGKSTTNALRSLAERTGVDEINSLVAMLVQTERFGTSLADTLRVHAETLRVQRMQRAEEQAGKAPLKMMFPTLLIFAATLMVTLGPGFLQLTALFTDGN